MRIHVTKVLKRFRLNVLGDLSAVTFIWSYHNRIWKPAQRSLKFIQPLVNKIKP
jgi:hypothetical protein